MKRRLKIILIFIAHVLVTLAATAHPKAGYKQTHALHIPGNRSAKANKLLVDANLNSNPGIAGSMIKPGLSWTIDRFSLKNLAVPPVTTTGLHSTADTGRVVQLSAINILYSYSGKTTTAIIPDTVRGGIFHKLPKGTNVADSIVSYPSNATDSLWYRDYSKSIGVMPQWYVSMPTDSTTNATVALNYFFSKYKSGKVSFNPRAVYLVDTIGIRGASNLVIEFNGAKINENGNQVGVILLSGTNVTLRGGRLKGSETYTSFQANSPTQTRALLYVTNSSNIRVENFVTSAKRTGIYFGKVTHSSITALQHWGFLDAAHKANANICPAISVTNDNLVNPVTAENGYLVISDVYAQDCGDAVILGDESKHFNISNVRGVNLFDNGIYVSSGLYGSITGNHFKNIASSGYAIKVRGRGINIDANTASVVGFGIGVTGNGNASSTDPYDGLPYPDAAGGNGYGLSVTYNTIDSASTRGISVNEQDGLGAHAVKIIGNTISNPLTATDYPLYVTGVSDFTINDNTIYNAVAPIATLVSNGTNDSLRNIHFSNNSYKLCTGIGVRFSKVRDSYISGNIAANVTGTFLDFRNSNNNIVTENKDFTGIVANIGATYTNTGNLVLGNTGTTSIDVAHNYSIFNNGAALSVTLGGLNTITPPIAGQIPIASGATAYIPKSISGDATLAASGVLTLKPSIALTGSPTAATQSSSSNNTSLATMAAVKAVNFIHNIFTPASGGSVTLVNHSYNIVNPSSGLAALTFVMPASPLDGDVVYVKFIQAVTSITWPAAVKGATASAASGGNLTLVYDAASSNWF